MNRKCFLYVCFKMGRPSSLTAVVEISRFAQVRLNDLTKFCKFGKPANFPTDYLLVNGFLDDCISFHKHGHQLTKLGQYILLVI